MSALMEKDSRISGLIVLRDVVAGQAAPGKDSFATSHSAPESSCALHVVSLDALDLLDK